MPLKLVPPREGKTPYFYVRGTYLGVPVFQSTKTGKRRVANQVLAKIIGEIERGEFAKPDEPTFEQATVNYMQAGGEALYLKPILMHFGEKRTLASISQEAIDECAQALYGSRTAATRNRQVYTPVSAVLKHAGVPLPIRRPKGSGGQQRTNWLWPEQAFALFREADEIDAEFGVFLRFLTYTGLRLSEALNLETKHVRLDEGFAYISETKGGDPRPVYLPGHIVSALKGLPCFQAPTIQGRSSRRVFRFTKSGRLYNLLREARQDASIEGLTFHHLRHSYATWMRRYAGLDTRALVGTGAWKDAKSASRYAHVVVSEDAMKAALLPVEKKK